MRRQGDALDRVAKGVAGVVADRWALWSSGGRPVVVADDCVGRFRLMWLREGGARDTSVDDQRARPGLAGLRSELWMSPGVRRPPSGVEGPQKVAIMRMPLRWAGDAYVAMPCRFLAFSTGGGCVTGRGRSDWRAQQARLVRGAPASDEHARRAHSREQSAEQKEAERRRRDARAAEAGAETSALEERVAALSTMLVDGVHGFRPLRLSALHRRFEPDALDLGVDEYPVPMPTWHEPRHPGAIVSWFGGRRRREHNRAVAIDRFEDDRRQAEADEAARVARVERRRRVHAEETRRVEEEVEGHNRWLSALEAAVADRQPAAVKQMAEMVLTQLPQPIDFPRRHEVLSSPDGDHVVVRWQLPNKTVVPDHRAVQYLPIKDEKRPIKRLAKDAAALYRSVVAQVCLLVARSLLVSDPGLAKATVSGHVDSVDPATGADAYPCLLSLVVDRDELPADDHLVRDGFDPEACVTALGALVSAHPYAQEPVEPLLDFDLTRFAFVDGLDAVSSLDSRPNLLDISPSLFEHLVRQVLTQKGDEGWTTTESNDSGIDAVIINRSKIMGGLSVVQAKRYKPSTRIGPAHVRELAGAMEEKKAGWGILVTTSSFTAGTEQKAREHGRMQLISGEQLCWLIKERMGKDVLIG